MVLQPPNRQGIDLSSWPTLNDQSSLNKAEIATLPPYNTYVSNFRRVSSLEKAKLLFSFCQGISKVPCIVSTPCFFKTEARDSAIMEQRIFFMDKRVPFGCHVAKGKPSISTVAWHLTFLHAAISTSNLLLLKLLSRGHRVSTSSLGDDIQVSSSYVALAKYIRSVSFVISWKRFTLGMSI